MVPGDRGAVLPPVAPHHRCLGVLAKSLGLCLVVAMAACVTSALEMALLFHPDVDPSRLYYGTDTRGKPPLGRRARPVLGHGSEGCQRNHGEVATAAGCACRSRLSLDGQCGQLQHDGDVPRWVLPRRHLRRRGHLVGRGRAQNPPGSRPIRRRHRLRRAYLLRPLPMALAGPMSISIKHALGCRVGRSSFFVPASPLSLPSARTTCWKGRSGRRVSPASCPSRTEGGIGQRASSPRPRWQPWRSS